MGLLEEALAVFFLLGEKLLIASIVFVLVKFFHRVSEVCERYEVTERVVRWRLDCWLCNLSGDDPAERGFFEAWPVRVEDRLTIHDVVKQLDADENVDATRHVECRVGENDSLGELNVAGVNLRLRELPSDVSGDENIESVRRRLISTAESHCCLAIDDGCLLTKSFGLDVSGTQWKLKCFSCVESQVVSV